jgi:hypothetical protein
MTGIVGVGRGRPILTDLVPPILGQAVAVQYAGGRATPPAHVVYHYEFQEWELFIREWATGLSSAQYVQIKLMGGGGDHGVDVAGFKSEQGFEGPWDCFQGKHYSRPVAESDALPEILKIFVGVARNHYVLPDSYRILAPQGCGGSLEKLFSSPSKLKSRFVARLVVGDPLVKGITTHEVALIAMLAEKTDFSIFASVQFEDMIETHRRTHYYPIRFGGPLNERPADKPLPDLSPAESVYVEQLVNVYVEKYPGTGVSAANVADHKQTFEHFRRQRVTFYRAEALRKFAESSVPTGTFERLQDDVYFGVVDAAERPHESSFHRMATVLTCSGALSLANHVLMSVADNRDVLGICHQLVNGSRLFWDREAQH